jgi:hypothetical protein
VKLTQPEIRKILKAAADGLTVAAVSRAVDKRPCNVQKALRSMPDVYVDRWAPAKAGPHKYAAVYALAEIPEDAPYPDQ